MILRAGYPSVEEVLAQIPAGTDVIVINEDGQAEPLTTQDAAELILTSDPIWCPAGQIPGDIGCTAGYATAAELVTALNGVTGDGTIYFTPTYSTNDLTFDHTNVNLSGLDALTIQGGWNGSSGNAFALSGSTLFSDVGISITNWNGNITLNNIVVDGSLGDGITIYYTNSDIQFTNVGSNNNGNDGFYIESNGEINATNIAANDNGFAGAVLSGGDGVTLNGINTFNDNDNSYGLGVFSYTDIGLNNIQANSNNGGQGVYIDNTAGSGDVVLNGSNTFNGNIEGLFVLSNGNITANNIEANSNVGNGAYVDNNLFGGNGSVVISGTNIFNANGNYGLIVNSSEDITASNITANDNGGFGGSLDNRSGVGDVTISGTNIFNGNNQLGLEVYSNGEISINNITASGNIGSGAALHNFTGSGDINLTGTNNFNNNVDSFGINYGLGAQSNGDINLNNITASNNGAFGNGGIGVFLENNLGGNGNIIFSGTNTFNNNDMSGVNAVSTGNITMENVTANNNGLAGLDLGTLSGNIEITCGTITGNGDYGIGAEIYSNLTLNGVTLSGNTNSDVTVYGGGTLVTNPFDCNPVSSGGSGNKNQKQTLFFITPLTQAQLPAALDEGNTFGSALKLVFTAQGKHIGNLSVSLTFPIPDGMQDANLAVLLWNGFAWVEVPGGSVVDGNFVITVSTPGIYVLVSK